MQLETITLTPGLKPVAPILRVLGEIPRPELETWIEAAIQILDAYDGDSDHEDTGAEDDLSDRAASKLGDHYGPGCAVSDAGGGPSNEDWPDFYEPDRGPGCPIADPDCEHDGREPLDAV